MNYIILSIIVPCYNEEENISIFYKEACNTLEIIGKKNSILGEFIFVDDGSRDKTRDILNNLNKEDKRVHYISFSRNFGKEAAIFAGLSKSKGNYVAIMDADLQDPPSLILEMFEAVSSGGYDCARAKRVTRKGENIMKSFFAKSFYKVMSKIADVRIEDGARDFSLMNRKYVEAVLKLSERIRFSKGIFNWVGFKTKYFGYENIERSKGDTKWSLIKLFLYALDGIIAFSSKPLIISSVFSCLLFIIALFLTSFIIVRKLLFGDPVNGWASTMCVILLCGSIQLLTIGILGQYLARVYTEVKGRPLYIVKEEE
ncbi:MAG: glycosyltransferase family 2 protein [Endomicrobium sp.]|jgi:glycosyltransferase involved in cell wall biosynthesis|nr:glycosyltransferase family 2 protein [Endomicrobium sp.]